MPMGKGTYKKPGRPSKAAKKAGMKRMKKVNANMGGGNPDKIFMASMMKKKKC